MKPDEVSATFRGVIDEVATVIVGKDSVIANVLYGILANGHILFEDYPGLAKTLMANCLARVLGCTFRRVQFTPDLLPADITGGYIFNRQTSAFELRKGPIFSQILLGDEINRAPPKTQSALLEGMQERQVTIEGDTFPLPQPFHVMATQNPIEYEGTYPLPEAQLDRFLLKLRVGYPDPTGEGEIIRRRLARRQEKADLKEVCSAAILLDMQKSLEDIHLDQAIIDYIVAVVRATRDLPQVDVGASPRGSLALTQLSRARAAVFRRDFVTPDDVKYFTTQALAHRLVMKPDALVRGMTPEAVVDEVSNKVPVPKLP